MAWEVESEFGAYTGDCVWAAVHMAAGQLAPARWPLPDYATLNRLTQEAISAGIGVGSEGQANPGQLLEMLTRWGMAYTVPYAYNGYPIAEDILAALVTSARARHKPVILGFTNGQALPGDEVGLHGHAIAVLHDLGGGRFGCGDGDNPVCRAGLLAVYTLAQLVAAAPDSAVIITEVPGSMLAIQETNGQYIEKAGFPPDTVWSCTVPGHQFDVQHAVLDKYRELAPVGGIALPLENLTYIGAPGSDEAVQSFDLWRLHYKGSDTPQVRVIAPVAAGPTYLHAGPATLSDDGNALHLSIPYTLSGQP